VNSNNNLNGTISGAATSCPEGSPSTCRAGFYWTGDYFQTYNDKGLIVTVQECMACNYLSLYGYGYACPTSGFCWDGSGYWARVPCPAGLYSDEYEAVSCKPCWGGTYSVSPGSSACRNCPVGQYNRGPDFRYNDLMTYCQGCPPGYTSVEATTFCFTCAPGQVNNHIKQQPGCTNCAAGKYSTGISESYCTNCDMGKFIASQGSTASSTCQTCGTDCPENTFKEQDCQIDEDVRCCARYKEYI